MESRQITPEMARTELQRRQAARDELTRRKEEKIKMFSDITGAKRNPVDALKDVLVGTGNAGQNLAGFLTSGYAPKVNIEEAFEDKNPNKLIQGIAQYAPAAISGGGGLAGQLGAGAAFGITQAEPNQENLGGVLPKGRIGAGIEDALINALTHGAFKGIEALRPSKLLRGKLSPEDLNKNLEVAQDTPTGLGDVIGSPMLKRQHENVLTKVPFSGANEKFQEAGQAVTNRGQELLSQMLGKNDPENVTDQLTQALKTQFNQHQNLKNRLYDDVNNLAKAENLKLDLPKFSSTVKDYREAINDTTLLKYEPDVRKIFNKLGNYEKGVNSESEPTLKEANLLKGKLNHYAEMLKSSPDPEKRHAVGVFRNLASSLKADIQESIDKSGSRGLKVAYNNAEENYAKNFSPFLDKELYKYISGKADPDTIAQNFVKISKASDRKIATSKIQSRLDPQDKNLLAYSYFSRALDKEGNLNPGKFSTLIDKLGKNQMKVLIDNPELSKALTNYSKLQKMNNKGVTLMQNPATGQQNLDVIPGLVTHAGASMAGGLVGGIPGALAGLIGPGLAARPIVKALTSPSVREKLVKAMIENKSWNKNITPALQSVLQGANKFQGS